MKRCFLVSGFWLPAKDWCDGAELERDVESRGDPCIP